MRNHRQLGSALVIVSAVLLIALMAALGVIFYQNFLAKKPDGISQTQQTDTTTNTASATARTAFNSTIYSLTYPESWKTETKQNEAGKPAASTTTITSPDGKVQVVLAVSETQDQTDCDTSDGLKLSFYKVYDSAVTKLTDTTSLYLVESISDTKGGGYQYAIGLTPDGGATHAAVGDSHCNIVRVGQAATVVRNGDTLSEPGISATIVFPKLPTSPKPAASDMQTIQDLIASDTYKTATQILQSARKE